MPRPTRMTEIKPTEIEITYGDEIKGGTLRVKLKSGKTVDIEDTLRRVAEYIRTVPKCKIEIRERL